MGQEITKQFDLVNGDSKNFSLKVEGKTVVCSEYILPDLVILRLQPGHDKQMGKIKEQLEKAQQEYSKKSIVILPSWVEVLKPIPSVPTAMRETCPQCEGTVRSLGPDEFVCLSCGYKGTRTLLHLQRVIGQGGIETI